MNQPAVLLLYNINPGWPESDILASRQEARIFSRALQEAGHQVTELCLDHPDLGRMLEAFSPEETIVFNWCEELPGINHSYDLIAGTLERRGFTFTGSDSATLAFSQDKRKVKKRLSDSGVSTPPWKITSDPHSNGWKLFPAMVKPALEHCSFGITAESVVFSPAELSTRIEFVLENFHQPALIEEFIDGREFHVGVVGNGKLAVLPPAEMDFTALAEVRDHLCSYESKFDPSSRAYNLIRLKLPAPLSPAEQELLASTAISAYAATGCRDYARLDIRLREGIFYVLDVNPNADISPDTSLVLAAEQAGLTYGQFGSLLVQLASRRHPVFSNDIELTFSLPGD